MTSSFVFVEPRLWPSIQAAEYTGLSNLIPPQKRPYWLQPDQEYITKGVYRPGQAEHSLQTDMTRNTNQNSLESLLSILQLQLQHISREFGT